MAERQSVDLWRKTVSIESLKMADWEHSTQDTSEQEVTENECGDAVADAGQPDQLPDMRKCGGVCWRTMHEIAVRNPRAALVLLASAMGGMSNREIGRLLHVNPYHLQRQKDWLRKHYSALASVLKK